MIWNLGIGWLLMALATITVLGFFFGSALDAVMLNDGFGPTGNMVLFTVGFFGAIYCVNLYGIPTKHLGMACATGLGGAFLLIATLALLKAGMSRLSR